MGYNLAMIKPKFSIPVQVRSNDIDAWWHVSHVVFLNYLAHARFCYYREIGLLDNESFRDFQLIMADLHIAYKGQIYFGQRISVTARASRIGNKSMQIEHLILDESSGEVLAESEAILVGYDFNDNKTIRIPDKYRKMISKYEGVEY